MKVSFSFNKPKPAAASAPAPVLAKPAAFSATEEDDQDEGSLPTKKGKKGDNRHTAVISKQTKKRMEAEMQVDSSVFEYDEVWDRMQDVKQRQKEAKEKDAQERKPKYMHGLLNSAATRRLDRLRAEEKMMQRERELEGDEFKDKEVFVTQAYKDQMEEVRKAEEEEKKREEERKKSGAPSTGLAHFYRQLLDDSESQHEAAVAATQKRVQGPEGPSPNLTISKPADYTPTSDLELARLAREQGKEVELNDDNQIVDKRELLSAGLNLAGTNTRKLGLQTGKSSTSTADTDQAPVHRAVGTAASRREIQERRMREVKQQMAAEEGRLAKEKEDAEAEATRRIVAKRNNEVDVMSARERYLERKRRKLEEPQTNTES